VEDGKAEEKHGMQHPTGKKIARHTPSDGWTVRKRGAEPTEAMEVEGSPCGTDCPLGNRMESRKSGQRCLDKPTRSEGCG